MLRVALRTPLRWQRTQKSWQQHWTTSTLTGSTSGIRYFGDTTKLIDDALYFCNSLAMLLCCAVLCCAVLCCVALWIATQQPSQKEVATCHQCGKRVFLAGTTPALQGIAQTEVWRLAAEAHVDGFLTDTPFELPK